MTATEAQRCGYCGAELLLTDLVHYPQRRGECEVGSPLLGTLIDGKYRLLGVLGRGGLGTVFRAQHVGSLAVVALKLLHPRLAERAEYRRMLLPEAQRAATVVHEHCARVIDVGADDEGIAYLAMELVEGQTLDELVQAGSLAPSHAVDVLVQVCDALAAIHQAGLVHCDLSPRNVMVSTRHGRLDVKVLDFGIARSMSMTGAGGDPADLHGFANPAFSAPEVLAGGDVDARADLYSVGALAWLLLTGGLPVLDAGPRAAAIAVAEGRLLPWPPTRGVPRRLVRLVQRCLAYSPAERPSSAAEVQRQLLAIRARGGPLLRRAAAAAAGFAVVASIAVPGGSVPPFLRPWSGAPLQLTDESLSPDRPVLYLQSAELATIGLHYGGFNPRSLAAEIARGGAVLARIGLQPRQAHDSGSLLLSASQPGWSRLLQELARASADGPVDLAFLVPGTALLGAVRLLVDDQPPGLDVQLAAADDGLTAATRLTVAVADDVGVASVAAEVRFERGPVVELPLPVAGGEFPLGAALAAVLESCEELGGGTAVVEARDRAGNRRCSPPLSFAAADVAAPSVVEAAGPFGEPFAVRRDERVRFRLRLSAAEEGCELLISSGRSEPIAVPLAAVINWQTVEVPLPRDAASGEELEFTVVDRAGNRSPLAAGLQVQDRSLRLEFTPEPGASWRHGELVVGDRGGVVVVHVGDAYQLVGASLPDGPLAVVADPVASSRVRLMVPALPPGQYAAVLRLREVAGEQFSGLERRLAVRVLPAVVELRLPALRARFASQLVAAGVLSNRGDALTAGPALQLGAGLRPFVEGALWVGADVPIALPLRFGDSEREPLLPEIVPVPGRNVWSIELRDALGRPVAVVADDEPAAATVPAGPRALVDFWWHDAPPEPVGEELLVEHGQPARVRLRFPVPFEPGDLAAVRLGIGQSEIAAQPAGPPAGASSVVAFEVPFAVWSLAAQLADRSPVEFAGQLERRLEVSVASPLGRRSLVLRLRTVRSTLAPLRLGELGELPADLGDLRLLPVLAPPESFAEPVPVPGPPRPMFRPQPAVVVRNLGDFLLQDREFTCGQARCLAAMSLPGGFDWRRIVHGDDPLGAGRLDAAALVPAAARAAPAAAALSGASFYQAYALCRLLGVAVAGDPALFRLPFGVELELAAYAGALRAAGHGAAAAGGGVELAAMLAAPGRRARGESIDASWSAESGDQVPTEHGLVFLGLDFGLREWVLDLPWRRDLDLLWREWVADHTVHVARATAMAEGRDAVELAPFSPVRRFGVVRGLAFGELHELIGERGRPVGVNDGELLPPAVPGVLRAEQLLRDGRDLLSSGVDPRLKSIGFRVACAAAALNSIRGRQ